ncbi:hypothetical protein [Paramesorhizobium deserti]|nr:hypothetical protein [Paramesorhizobium deserti]
MIETLKKLNLDLLKFEDQKIAASHLEYIMEQALDARHVFFSYLIGMAVIELRSIIKERMESTESVPCGGRGKSEKFLRMMNHK